MAIWEYRCHLVPFSTKEPIENEISDDGFIPELEEDWVSLDIGAKVLEYMRRRYTLYLSWSEDILLFKSHEHKIEIFLDEESQIIEGVYISIDLRTESIKEFISDIITLCQKFSLRIFDCYSFDILDANEEGLRVNIKKSNAYKFVLNPHYFLNKLSENS